MSPTPATPHRLPWCALTDRDLPAIAALAARVLAADGGLPVASEEPFLARRYAGDGARAYGVRDGAGALIAAGSVRPGPRDTVAASTVAADTVVASTVAADTVAASTDAAGPVAAGVVLTGMVVTGLVDPAARGRGLGAALLDRLLADAGATGPGGEHGAGSVGAASAGAVTAGGGSGGAGSAGVVTVQTESLTAPAAALFASRGFRQVFAEDVMRFDLTGTPPPETFPAGVRLVDWSGATVQRFFDVYATAFADRPNYPGWTLSEWLAWLTEDGGFRPECSLLAVDAYGDAGFVTCAENWIVQVGVCPDRRGRGLGAGLIGAALRRLRAAGEPAALLDVNVDNPADDLYRRLGFQVIGRRARFARGRPVRTPVGR